MIRKTLTLLLFYFGLSFSYSQCINDSNKIGYFDESSISTNWTTTGNGSNFSVETLDFYYREQSKTGGALKVVVNSDIYKSNVTQFKCKRNLFQIQDLILLQLPV